MYHCTFCDAQYPKWSGRCAQCEKWGTLQEDGGDKKTSKAAAKAADVVTLKDVGKEAVTRTSTQIEELDRVLGGGIVPGQVTLLSGEPGIGKSTLLSQLVGSMKDAMYIAGEESPRQLKLRLDRLKIDAASLKIVTNTAVESIVSSVKKHTPSIVIIDSIQSLTTNSHDGAPGSPTHLRAATAQLVATAKETDTPIVIVGQVTKDGTVAGPKMLEHMVDTVLHFDGDPRHAYRLLRTSKHRFGTTDEVGVFEMTSEGLKGVPSPAQLFLNDSKEASGTAVTCVMKGMRPFLLEIQALVHTSSYGTPVRRGSGFPTNRLQMLLAILEKHGGVSFAGQDVYVNVTGGMSVKEPSVDLAVCAALVSSRLENVVNKQTIIFGEVGLGGEVRSVPLAKRRQKEAKRLGFSTVLSHETIPHIRALVSHLKPKAIPLRSAPLTTSPTLGEDLE